MSEQVGGMILAGGTLLILGFGAGVIVTEQTFEANTRECTLVCPNGGESILFAEECYCKVVKNE